MIREWKLEDMLISNRFVKFMKAFEMVTQYVKVDVDYAYKRYVEMMKMGIVKIIVAENEDGSFQGAIGFIIADDLHDGTKMAVETFWFALPEYKGIGSKLFLAFEEEAKKLGCKRLAMIHLADSYPECLKGFYLKNGYKLVESHYLKEI